MTVDEFERLRRLPGKIVLGDIEFAATGANREVYRVDRVIGTFSGIEIRLSGKYNNQIPSLTFNFSLAPKGSAICRYCINEKGHKDRKTGKLARTHKHTPEEEVCFDDNLPIISERLDLKIASFADVSTVWDTICKEANIQHQGKVIQK